ncbi:hypothetical protein Lser_V15G35889 [Lactuca serriola]
MIGDGVNKSPNTGIEDEKHRDHCCRRYNATNVARGAFDIVLTKPGLIVIISAVITSQSIFQIMKNYTVYDAPVNIRIVRRNQLRARGSTSYPSKSSEICIFFMLVLLVVDVQLVVSQENDESNRTCSYLL